MKLKHVFFSGLLMSTVFVACTNEDFETVGTPDYTKDAISLGENFTISGGLLSGNITRAIYEEEADGSKFTIKSKWEPKDSIGGAWYAALTKPATGTAAPDGFLFNGNFASNHPFDRVNKVGYLETAEFETVTNVFAGKYILYYPYNSTVAKVSSSIPVVMETAQTMNVSAPLQHVNETMFFYDDTEYTTGGNQASDFKMSPVPVICRLAFRATEDTRGLVGQNISMVVVETKDEKFFSAGEVKVENRTAQYKDAKAVYAGDEDETTNVYTLTITGNESNADYQVSAVGDEGGMKKPFYLSMLPAAADIEEVTVKVVTDKGEVYKKVLNLNESSLSDAKTAITSEGGEFAYYITLDEKEEGADDAIYTVQQFNNAWEDALESNDEQAVINLGAPLSLDELTLNQVNANIKIDGNPLTVGTLTVEDGDLEVSELVATDVNVASYGVLNTTETTIKGLLSVEGEAALDDITTLKDVKVARAGNLTLTGGKVQGAFTADLKSTVSLTDIELAGTNKMNGSVTTAGTKVTFSGVTTLEEDATLTANNATDFKNTLTNKGKITASAVITLYGTTVNDNEIANTTENNVVIAKSGSLTNNGTLGKVTNNGTLKLAVATTSQITNNGTLEVTAADGEEDPADLSIVNSKTVNINLSSKDNQVTVADLENKGKVYVNRGVLAGINATSTTGSTGDIEIAADGAMEIDADNLNYPGYIIVKAAKNVAFHDATSAGYLGDTKVACYYADMSKATDADWVIINSPITVNEANKAALAAKSLLIQADVTLGADLTMEASKNVTVDGEISLKKTAAEDPESVTLSGASSAGTFEITAGSLLKVYENVTLITTNFANKYYNTGTYGNAVKMGGGITE